MLPCCCAGFTSSPNRREEPSCIMLTSLFAVSWVLPGTAPSSARRRIPAVRACTPFRSDEEFDYFRRQKEYSFSLTKPLGAVSPTHA